MTQQKPVLLEGRKKVCYVPEDMERRAKGPDAIVLMSVWSNPYISEIGVTQNAVANIARYTSMSESDVDASLRRLDKAKEVVFDPETQEVMAPEWIQYNFDEEDDDSTTDEEAPDLLTSRQYRRQKVLRKMTERVEACAEFLRVVLRSSRADFRPCARGAELFRYA